MKGRGGEKQNSVLPGFNSTIPPPPARSLSFSLPPSFSQGLIFRTTWLENKSQKFFIRTFSESDRDLCHDAALKSSDYTATVFGTFEGGGRDTSLGWMLANACLFEASVKAVGPGRNNLTTREVSLGEI